ncbi:hypothetical protein [Rhodococcus yananensis]|uniref:hypothetical protein n=1 Tax=Rhodococcus yananensis TaxID=2879464 RepID=UPI001CF871B4|nr:hypothetical protein [Rhodococcus yananensis]
MHVHASLSDNSPPVSDSGAAQTTEDPGRWGERTDRWRDVLRSTPAKLVALGIVLAALVIASGAVSAQAVNGRKATHDRLLTTVEPLANAAQDLYSALSVADAAATTGFIAGGIEPVAVRDRYHAAIDEASVQLVVAAAGLAEEDRLGAQNVAEIARTLPIYAGLIETARTANRTGNPVGSAYLSEASALMQNTMLPVAQELHTQGVDAVGSTQRAAVRPPWVAIGLLILTVTAMCIAHVLVSRRTHRTFNLGLLLAIGAMGVLLCWLLIAGLASSSATQRALEQGARPLATLTESRILAQQARTAETLLLARRDSSGTYDHAFDDSMTRLGDRLDGYTDDGAEIGGDAVARAAAARTAWIASHNRTVAALARGDYEAAAVLATGTGPDETAAQSATVDAALGDAIEETRAELRDNEFRASRTLSGLTSMSIALSIVALVCIIVGLFPRYREYH